MWDGLDELLHQISMMGIELVPETSIFNKLTWLIAVVLFVILKGTIYKIPLMMSASFNKLFKATKLTLNFDISDFGTTIKTCINLNVDYDNKTKERGGATKFLGLQIDNLK
jgi:hypothetical protein